MVPTMQALADAFAENGVLKTPAIIRAFARVDRKDFVLPEYANRAYADTALLIGHGGTISQPFVVAFMLELLAPKAGEKIMEVGSGSGWVTALLAEIVGEAGRVRGVEIVPELREFGRANLAKYRYPQAEITAAEKRLGFPEEAPFDKIIVSAAAKKIPQELVDQLKTGGRMVMPVQDAIVRVDKVSEENIETKKFEGFVFVPLVE